MKGRMHPFQQYGFTLLELLVVMTLMSLIMLAMAGALRGMGQTETRIDQRLERMDELRVVTGFLNASIGNISARTSDVLSPAGKPVVVFSGQARALSWVGVMPARDGAGGRYYFKLGLEAAQDTNETEGGGSALTLRMLPYGAKVRLPDWAEAEVRVLVPHVKEFSLVYEDRRESPSLWKSAWDVDDRLPDAVKISLTTTRNAWPALVVPLRILPFGLNSGGGVASFGGGATR